MTPRKSLSSLRPAGMGGEAPWSLTETAGARHGTGTGRTRWQPRPTATSQRAPAGSPPLAAQLPPPERTWSGGWSGVEWMEGEKRHSPFNPLDHHYCPPINATCDFHSSPLALVIFVIASFHLVPPSLHSFTHRVVASPSFGFSSFISIQTWAQRTHRPACLPAC